MNLRSKLARVRHVGPVGCVRVVRSQAWKKALRHPLLRDRLDRACAVDGDELMNAIDFGACEKGDLVAHFVTNCPTRHFLDSPLSTAALAKEVFPEAVGQTLAKADAICRHEFEFLGRDVSFGEDIDWFWRPEGDESWPKMHMDDYGHGFWADSQGPGDVKYPWELNRHQYFVTLAKAYLLSGDERYVREIVTQVTDWRVQNPARFGLNWTSAMEIAIRMISWSNMLWMVRDSKYFQEHGLEPVLTGLYEHARCLSRSLTTHWFVRNNHIIGEAAGLFTFATLFPMFRGAKCWQKIALDILVRETASQVWADGVNKEQSTAYHRFVLDFLLLVIRLAELNRIQVPKVLYERRERMLEYEWAIVPSCGVAPGIGDCDDGRGFLLSDSVPFLDFRGWQAVGAVLLDREDFAAVADGGNDESLWFLGAVDWARFEKMSVTPAPRPSVLFRKGGQAVLRAGAPQAETVVMVRCGHFGLGGRGSSCHSHADLLAPIIFWRGLPMAIDTGTHSYCGDTEQRDAYRSAAAHNTMTPRGCDQGRMHTIWDWDEVPSTEVNIWKMGRNATHLTATCATPQGYTHRRELILEANPLRLEIRDELAVEGGRPLPIDWRLHFAPGVALTEAGPNRIAIGDPHSPHALLTCEGFDECEIMQTRCYPGYGQSAQNLCLRLAVFSAKVDTRVWIEDRSELGRTDRLNSDETQ